jgi:aryl-alcohol dehydrogenase-like predicted oxidoreductase
MQYREIGQTGMKASVVALGTWPVGKASWGEVDDDASVRAIQASLDAGVTLVDTAPPYGKGHSERIVGKALAGRRHEVLIATKCGTIFKQDDSPFTRCLTPESVRQQAEDSLTRLGIDVIDIYFCHWPDVNTPIEDTVGALTDLQKQGKIRAFGLSNHGPDLIRRAAAAGPLSCIQDHYSLVKRDADKEILPLVKELGLAFFAYGPLGGGILSGKYTEIPVWKQRDARDFFYPFYREPAWSRVQKLLADLRLIADRRNITPAQAAIGWANARPGVAACLVGAKTEAQARANAAAADVHFTEDEMRQLTMLSDRAVEGA